MSEFDRTIADERRSCEEKLAVFREKAEAELQRLRKTVENTEARWVRRIEELEDDNRWLQQENKKLRRYKEAYRI